MALALPSLAESVYSNVVEYDYPNGLKLLVLPRHNIPILSLQIWYRAGSRDESPGQSGLAHFLEHMYSMGSENYGPRDVDRLVKSVGGRKNASTWVDYTRYFVDMPSGSLETFLAVEAERMRGCLFPKDKVLSERNTVAEERRSRNEDSPSGAAYEELMELVYGNHPYSHPTVGYMDDIAEYSREKLLSYYDTYYHPDNATIVIVGDAEPEAAYELVGRYFGGLPGVGGEFPNVPVYYTSQDSERRVTFRHPSPLPLVYIGWPGVPFSGGLTYTLDVLGEVLLGGRSSRLYRRLVRGDELATSVVGGYSDRKLTGTFAIRVNFTDPGDAGKVERAVYEEIARIAAEGVESDELKNAKKRILASEVYGAGSNNGLARQIGWTETLGGWRHLLTYTELVEMVRVEDVRLAAENFLSEDKRSVVVVLPEDEGSYDDAGGGA